MLKKIAAGLKLPVGVVKPVGEGLAFSADGSDFAAEFVFRPALLGGEIEEVVFFVIQHFKTLAELVAQLSVQFAVAIGGLVNARAHGGDEIIVEPYRGVVLFDCLFHSFDRHKRMVADVVLSAATEKVKVLATESAFGVLQDEACPAAFAPQ